MNDDWSLTYEGYEPDKEGLREVLCALGNGYMVSRAAAADASADDIHYPGNYFSGGYDRLTTEIDGHQIENEDLVNLPNWLLLTMQIGEDDCIHPDRVEFLDYRQDAQPERRRAHAAICAFAMPPAGSPVGTRSASSQWTISISPRSR